MTKSTLKFRGHFHCNGEEYDIPSKWLDKNAELTEVEKDIISKWYTGFLNPTNSSEIQYQTVYCENGLWLGVFLIYSNENTEFSLFTMGSTPIKAIKKLQKAIFKIASKGAL